jgi:hypothetical protein
MIKVHFPKCCHTELCKTRYYVMFSVILNLGKHHMVCQNTYIHFGYKHSPAWKYLRCSEFSPLCQIYRAKTILADLRSSRQYTAICKNRSSHFCLYKQMFDLYIDNLFCPCYTKIYNQNVRLIHKTKTSRKKD